MYEQSLENLQHIFLHQLLGRESWAIVYFFSLAFSRACPLQVTHLLPLKWKKEPMADNVIVSLLKYIDKVGLNQNFVSRLRPHQL